MLNPDYFDINCAKCKDTVRAVVEEYKDEYKKLQKKADKLAECSKHLLFLNDCEMEGIASSMPTPDQWMKGFDELQKTLKE